MMTLRPKRWGRAVAAPGGRRPERRPPAPARSREERIGIEVVISTPGQGTVSTPGQGARRLVESVSGGPALIRLRKNITLTTLCIGGPVNPAMDSAFSKLSRGSPGGARERSEGPPNSVQDVGSVVDMGRAVARVLWPRKVRDDVVRGAGGILLRGAGRRPIEVAVVHRPARGDWSLPKGKLDPGESYESCALREVLEETGYRCRLVSFVGFTEYRDRRGRPKVVGYWVMEVLDGEFAVSDEVDELQWLDLDVASRILTYERDRELLAALDTVDVAASG